MTKTPPPTNVTSNGCNAAIFVADSKWYAVYTRSRFEKKLFQNLQKSKKQAFLPLIKEKRAWSDRMKMIMVPLLPSYVFVKLPKQDLYQIYSYPGVVRLVSFEGKPCEIREEEIGLLETIVLHGTNVKCASSCMVGDSVKIIQGPLTGWEGKVERLCGQSRVVFQFDSIQQAISVEVNLEDIEKY
jgi:transcription antitermination factor NusG